MGVRVVKVEGIQRKDLGSGSWAKELLTEETVGAKKTMLAISVFKPGTGAAARIHEEEELCYILKGTGVIEFEGGSVQIRKGMAVYIPPNLKHSVKNVGEEDLSMVYVFSYPKYPPTKVVE